jgi:glycosyltransferase involved in cell wall biosynthesis
MRNFVIDVLITCHNRRDQTINCLRSLFVNEKESLKFVVYLVDDGSTDSTTESIKSEFPQVHVIPGTGNLFWAAGMALAESSIQTVSPWTLWLNDDVILNSRAFDFFQTTKSLDTNSIWVGQISDNNGNFLYGAKFRRGLLKDNLQSFRQEMNQDINPITFNGNFVLMPVEVRKSVGQIDNQFSHGYADIDYGLRASKMGITIRAIPGYIGTTPSHTEYGVGASRNTFRQLISSPKGQPIQDQIRFFRRHAKFTWIFYVLVPFLRVIKFKVMGFIKLFFIK